MEIPSVYPGQEKIVVPWAQFMLSLAIHANRHSVLRYGRILERKEVSSPATTLVTLLAQPTTGGSSTEKDTSVANQKMLFIDMTRSITRDRSRSTV